MFFGRKPQYSDSNSNCSSVNPTLASDIWKRLFPPRRSRWLPLSGSVWVPIPNTGIRMGSNINLFKLCSALRVLGYFMILLFAAIVALSYYAVVLITWGPLLFRSPLQLSSFFSAFFVLLLFHILLILLTWSYLMVVLNDPGSVPHNWRHHQQLRSDIDLETAPPTPSPAYCSRCQNGKPPRCHHCSICKQLSLTFKFSSSFYCSPSPHHFLLSVGQRCVLKMDHHCIWVVNCVGARNYKYFLLFLVNPFLFFL